MPVKAITFADGAAAIVVARSKTGLKAVALGSAGFRVVAECAGHEKSSVSDLSHGSSPGGWGW